MIRCLIVAVVAVGLVACPTQIGDRCGEGLPPCSSGFSCVEGTCSLEAVDAGHSLLDAGVDGGVDAGVDAGFDAGVDAGFDAGVDAGFDAGVDAGFDAGVDAGFDAGPPMHLGSVIESWTIPANATQVSQIGFDLSGDGGVDNQLSAFLIALPFAEDFRNGLATSTDTGELIVLEDIEYWSGGAATLRIYRGANAMPPACDGVADSICRKHLDGGAAFTIASVPIPNTGLSGTRSGSNLQGSGSLELPLRIGSTQIELPLRNARIESVIGGVATLGGAVARSEVQTRLVPALVTLANEGVARDCFGAPPSCGCMGGSIGASTIATLDSVHDCTISASELIVLLPPSDLDATGDGVAESLSIGIRYTSVRAVFPMQ
ncbi:MAG: hypothetical protein JNM69_06325 [Archangium sp.]|nr:hypothetical protein [Archangium sp.]